MTSSELIGMAWIQAWQLAALIATVALIARFAAKRNPHLAHVLWLVVLAKCVTPPVIASPGGIFCWLQAERTAATWQDAAPHVGAVPQGALGSQRLASLPPWKSAVGTFPPSPAGIANPSPGSENHSDGEFSATTGSSSHAEMVESGAEAWNASAGANFSPILSVALSCCGALWIAGGLAVLVITALRVRSCVRSIDRNRTEHRADLDTLLADLVRRLKLRRRVQLIVTTGRIGPAVVGLLRPTIVLPEVVVVGKTPQELETILAHELIHVRRGDLWVGLWQVAAQALWWFHPLVWLASRHATRAAEACCDEEVLAELRCEPEHYARSLLAVLEQKRGLLTIPAFPGMRPVDVTRERMEHIMQLGQGCRSRTPSWCWLVLLAVAGVALPGAAFVTAADESIAPPLSKPGPQATSADDSANALAEARESADVARDGQRQASDGGRNLDGADDEPLPPVSERKFKLKFPLHRDPATGKVDQALLVDAAEVFLPSDPGSDSAIELQKNVLILQEDGSIQATADRAVITNRRVAGAALMVDELRIELSGKVRWTSGGLKASAGKLIASLRPAFGGDASAPRLRTLHLGDGAHLAGPDFDARAGAISVAFSKLAGVPPGQPAQILLEGGVSLSHSKGAQGTARIQADRIEVVLPRNELKVEGDVRVEGKSEQSIIVGTVESAHARMAAAKRDRRRSAENNGPTGNELVTKTYPVADLVVPVQHLHVTLSDDGKAVEASQAAARPALAVQATAVLIETAEDGSAAVRKGFRVEKEPLAGNAHDPRVAADFEALMNLIQSTVIPDSWEALSGPGSMVPYRTTLSLVIRQTMAVHDEIADLLGQLRRLRDLSAVLEIEVITVAGASAKMPLQFENDPTDAKEGAVCLADEERKQFLALISKSKGLAASMKSPRLTLFNGQGAELKLRRPQLTKGSVALPTLHLLPVIAADRSAIRLQLAAGASKPLDALARSHGYVIGNGQSLLVDMTNELSWNHVGGPIGEQASAIRRQHKLAPAERVLLLITPQINFEEEELIGIDLAR